MQSPEQSLQLQWHTSETELQLREICLPMLVMNYERPAWRLFKTAIEILESTLHAGNPSAMSLMRLCDVEAWK